MDDQKAIWSDLTAGSQSEHKLRTIMWRVAGGLSDIAGRSISSDNPVVETIPIYQVTQRAGDPEAKVVSIYLVIIETAFKDGRGSVVGYLWVLPDPSILDLAEKTAGKETGGQGDKGMRSEEARRDAQYAYQFAH